MPEDNMFYGNIDKNARIWGMLCHLTALLGIIGIPLGHLFGPLTVWLLKRNSYPFVREQGIESLNFQLSMTLYIALAAAFLYFTKIGLGMILILIMATINALLVIIASVRAYNGETYAYPLKIRFIK
jgi:uncharacterized Tic20 family protein